MWTIICCGLRRSTSSAILELWGSATSSMPSIPPRASIASSRYARHPTFFYLLSAHAYEYEGQRAAVQVFCTCVQGDWLSPRVHCGQARPRHSTERDQELGHEGDVCVL